MFIFEFNGGKVVIKETERYAIAQPIWGRSIQPKHMNRKYDKWVNAIKKAFCKL